MGLVGLVVPSFIFSVSIDSHNKTSTSVAGFASLNCKNIVLVPVVPDVSRLGIVEPDLSVVILRLSDSHCVLTASNVVPVVKDFASWHI